MKTTQSKKRKDLRRSPELTAEILSKSGDPFGNTKNNLHTINNIQLTMNKCVRENKPIPVFNNLMPLIYRMEILTLAYNNIKSNKGSMTPGTTDNTADKTSYNTLNNISLSLKNNTYRATTIRRTYLPKPGKPSGFSWTKDNLLAQGRPLGIPSFNDKLVQEAIRIVLSAIYEPLFEKINTNYGFRPGKGPQNAISIIPTNTQGMTRCLEGDIKGAFPSLDHTILNTILQKRIQDKNLLALITLFCKTGIFDDLDNSYHDPIVGVPQGGIISPLLWNIYMHEFDKFIVNDIQETFDCINIAQNRHETNLSNQNKSYKNASYKRSTLHKKITILQSIPEHLTNKELQSELKLLKTEFHIANKKLLKIPTVRLDRAKLRFFYIRYADDWILFTNANETFLSYIKNKITSFLFYHLALKLSIEKTKNTDLYNVKAKFLGFSIFRLKTSKISYTYSSTLTKRTTNNKVCISLDKDRILNRLQWKGYIDKKRKPREQPALSTLSDYEIIMKFNQIIRGFVNYYGPIIDIFSALNYFVYILEYSCYKTLCQKHRTTIRKLLYKFKNPISATIIIEERNDPNTAKNNDNSYLCTANTNLEKKSRTISLLTVKKFRTATLDTRKKIRANINNPKSTLSDNVINGNFFTNAKAYARTKFKFEGRCCICGCTGNIEMHHIKHIRNYNNQALKGFATIMGILNRKQIPVCSFHHDLIHSGNYDGISLTDLYDTRVSQVENYLSFENMS